VYLYEARGDNGPKFTFPATRKALATFPELAAIGLVEYGEKDARRLGVTVKSKAQAVAAIAHLKETMKEEHPRLFCCGIEKATKPRIIELDAKK
jgi:hypothetical protein